jgi:hypothetical protein
MSDQDFLTKALKSRAELPMTMQAFDLLSASLVAAWTKCADPQERENLWFRLKGLQDVEQMLIAAAAEADVAEYREQLAEQGFQP